MNCTVKILNVAGLDTIWEYIGLPVGHKHKNKEEAITALSRLVAAGDEHAKLLRQVVVWMEVTAPRYWLQQLATYRIGLETWSASTMHTLLKKEPSLDDFTEQVASHTYRAFKKSLVWGSITEVKANLPEGYLQTRLVMVSYQALRRIWLQRRAHRLPEWARFIESMHELPYCHDLIFVEPHNPWRELWIEWFDHDGEPWLYDHEQAVTFCIFCGNNKEYGHSFTCIYPKAKQLLDKEAR